MTDLLKLYQQIFVDSTPREGDGGGGGEGRGSDIFMSHFSNSLSALGRVFNFLTVQSPILKFPSILGHNFFICPL